MRFGTSLPELSSSIVAVAEKSSEISCRKCCWFQYSQYYFLILGVTAIVAKKFKVNYQLIHVDLPMLVGSAFFLSAMLWDGIFTQFEALLSLFGTIVYIQHATRIKRKERVEMIADLSVQKASKKLSWKAPVTMVSSVVAIYFGARYTVESVIALSEILAIGKEVLAIIPVSLGTSLPELAVSLTAVRKKKPEIALGNILGSNVFNSFGVMGIAGLFGTIIVPRNIISFGLPMMLIATLLYFFITQDREVTKWEGMLLVLFYIFFLGQIMFFL